MCCEHHFAYIWSCMYMYDCFIQSLYTKEGEAESQRFYRVMCVHTFN